MAGQSVGKPEDPAKKASQRSRGSDKAWAQEASWVRDPGNQTELDPISKGSGQTWGPWASKVRYLKSLSESQ